MQQYHIGQPKSVETPADNTTHSTSKQRVIYPSRRKQKLLLTLNTDNSCAFKFIPTTSFLTKSEVYTNTHIWWTEQMFKAIGHIMRALNHASSTTPFTPLQRTWKQMCIDICKALQAFSCSLGLSPFFFSLNKTANPCDSYDKHCQQSLAVWQAILHLKLV